MAGTGSARIAGRTVAIALMAIALCPAPAAAHGGGRAHSLYAQEKLTLGPEHALEHLRERRALRRWMRLPRAERRRIARRARSEALTFAHASAADAVPADVGQWDPRPYALPGHPINAVLMPTGKVLFWDRAARPVGGKSNDRANTSRAYVWDPAHPAAGARDVTPRIDLDGDGAYDNVPLFCSGQSLLPSGEVFAAGGTASYPDATHADFAGASFAFTFDPWTERWTRQPDMSHGRWYPGQVELADGRIAVLAGYDESGKGTMNAALEVFTPAAQRGGRGSWRAYPAGRLETGLYPHMILMPTGEVLLAGPYAEDSAALHVAELGGSRSAWYDQLNLARYHNAGNAVLLPGDPHGSMRVSLIGGYEASDSMLGVSIRSSETIDLNHPGAGWLLGGDSSTEVTPDLNVARSNANVVLLPDGTLVAVGGAAGKTDADEGANFTGGDQELKRVELYRPGVDDTWRLGPAQQKWRAYHSTALLLPDGRVWSSGDDYWAIGDVPNPYTTADTAELYLPPYLFAPGTRPSITQAPSELGWGQEFPIAVAGATPTRAVLVAPSAVTHGDDMNQRHVELQVTRTAADGLEVKSPPSPSVAPPGWYMLFVLDAAGAPSKATWVRLRPSPPPPTPTSTPAPAATPTATPSAPTPAPVARDRTPPHIKARILRTRPLRLRIRLDEAATVTVTVRHKKRRAHLAARRARVLRLKVRARHGTRLVIRVRARDAAGNVGRRTLRKRVR